MFSWSSRVVKCDGLFVNLSKHSSQSSGEWNVSPLCGPAEKGTQIALLSRPRQEAIICALLNLLFFFIQSAPSSTPKALQSQMRSCECHCSHMEMHMCPLEVQSTAQVLLFSAFPRPSGQPFRNKPTDNEDTLPTRRQIAVVKCQSSLSPNRLSLNQDSSRIEYQMQWDTWTWTIALVLLASII